MSPLRGNVPIKRKRLIDLETQDILWATLKILDVEYFLHWKSCLKCLKKCLWTIKSITLTFITLLVHKAGLWEAAEKFGRGDEKALQYPAQERGRHLQVHIQPRVCTESPNPGPIVTKKLQRLSARIIDHHVAMDITNNQENESRYIRLTLVKRIERTDKAICRVRIAQKIYMR